MIDRPVEDITVPLLSRYRKLKLDINFALLIKIHIARHGALVSSFLYSKTFVFIVNPSFVL